MPACWRGSCRPTSTPSRRKTERVYRSVEEVRAELLSCGIGPDALRRLADGFEQHVDTLPRLNGGPPPPDEDP
jgi:hypothetical protein